jgi:hypothetical protein
MKLLQEFLANGEVKASQEDPWTRTSGREPAY